jgi:hypothetical protein
MWVITGFAGHVRGMPLDPSAAQVETDDAGDFSRMSTEELRAYVYGEALPPKDPVKH